MIEWYAVTVSHPEIAYQIGLKRAEDSQSGI